MTTVFKNFKLIRHGEISHFSDLAVEDGRIIAIGHDLTGDRYIDGKGEFWLSAGFIDIHTHGGGGYDFMDADPDEYVEIARNHAKYGASSLYPTTVAASREELLATLRAFDEARKKNDGANLLGIHLEGPYISPYQAGAMDPKYIREPDREEYAELFGLSKNIRRMTIAPELKGAAELGIYMKEHGVIGSIGHTDAIAEQVIDAHYEGGYDLLTHMYSCMNMTKRQNGWRRAGAVE
ncbi:MAG: N-acetylglucosamine-6-phosphate deacetylase, partial [Clostridia bacterium]|nr:N-acetylglucosamine-6-phosphate deacetylase [Clostridia bacterium]